jgi:proteasome lid subunit RPN8/RPN11
MILTAAEVAAIRKQAEAEYPSECCGVVLVREGSHGERWLYACRNIQDELHRADPVRHPRPARTAYYIAHEDLLEINRRQMAGYEVRVIFHSHIDAGAYFSETDRRQALVDGQPTYPGTTYVVVAVHEGRAGDVRAFRWDGVRGDFSEVPLESR